MFTTFWMNVKGANLILLDMDRATKNIDTLISTNGKFIQFSAPGIKNVNSFKFPQLNYHFNITTERIQSKELPSVCLCKSQDWNLCSSKNCF